MFKRISAFIIAITVVVGMTSCSMPQNIFSDQIGASDGDGNESSVKDLYEFEFTMDGKRYYMPADFDYYSDEGWSFESPESASDDADDADTADAAAADNTADEETVVIDINTLLASGEYSDYIDIYKESYHVQVKFYNDTTTITNLGSCRVVGLKLDALGSSVPFTQFDGEIKFGSSYDDVVDVYGEPSYQMGLSSDTGAIASINDMSFDETAVDSKKCICYYMTKYSFVEFTFGIMDNTSDSLVNIVIENNIDPEDEYNYEKDREEVPDVISLYNNPDLLGQSISDFSFKYESNLYTLPIPVSEIVDDGWEFARGASIVVRSGTTEKGVVLRKGNLFIELMVHNYDTEKSQTAINCYAVSLSVGVTSPYANILMPQGVTLGTDAQELESLYTIPYLNSASSSNQELAEENLYLITEPVSDPLTENSKYFINKLETEEYIMYSYVMPDDVPTVTIPEEIKKVNDPNKQLIGTYRKHIDIYVSKMNNKVVYIYMQNCPEFIVDEAAIWGDQLAQAAEE